MILLNADDYALNPDVDRAILALADAGRLSAASVMTNMPGWPGSAAALSTRAPGLALGLHLNLTEGRPLSAQARTAMTVGDGDFASLSRLLMKALTAQLDRGVVAAEVRAQLDAFSDALGRLPDFIDGHQHAHILNGVRDALLDTIRGGPADQRHLRRFLGLCTRRKRRLGTRPRPGCRSRRPAPRHVPPRRARRTRGPAARPARSPARR